MSIIYSIISAKDPHLSLGFLNRIRKHYLSDITNKFHFMSNYCIDHRINSTIFTGDIFDHSEEDKWSFKKYRLHKRFLEDYKHKSGTSIHSNVGNHDMFFGYEESDETVFGEMVYEGVINNITINPIQRLGLGIYGVDFSNDKDKIFQKLLEINNTNDKYKVAILHSNIAHNKKEDDKIIDFSYEHLAESFKNIDMFICGHYHVGYPSTDFLRTNGTICKFINNWNLTRVVRDYETKLDEHTPEFEHIIFREVDGQIIAENKTVQIPFIKFDDAFIADNIIFNKKSGQELFNFFEDRNINELVDQKDKTDIELISEIVEKHQYSVEAQTEALNYLNK